MDAKITDSQAFLIGGSNNDELGTLKLQLIKKQQELDILQSTFDEYVDSSKELEVRLQQ